MNIDQIRRTPIYQAGLIHFGQATGHLSTQRFDGWAPDPGLPFVMEVEALSTHMLCVGSTGQGKTSAVLKPTVYQFLRSNVGGCLLACGKGALAADFSGLRNYIRLSPKRCVVALMEGLSPHQAVQTLKEINTRPGDHDKGQKDPIWDSLTEAHLRHAAYLLHALIETNRAAAQRVWFWSIWDWVRMAYLPVTEEALLLEYIQIIRAKHPGAREGLLREALVYFDSQFPQMEPKLRDGALAQVTTWTTDLLSHPEMLEWSKAETGVNPEACLYADGEGNCWTVGIDLPEVTYSNAGKTATAFIKARIYSAIKRRSDAPDGSWAKVNPSARPVLIVQDEFQLIATQSDYDLSPIGRQLGAWMLIASQTVESVYSKSSNEHSVNAFLDAFQSRIALSTSIATVKWLQEWQGFGTAWIPQFGSTQRTLNLVASAANALRSPIHERNHPSRFWFQRLRRQGVGGFLNSSGRLDIPSDTSKADLLASTLITGKGWKEEHLLQLADFNAMTKTKGVALACVMRAGTVRRDFIQLNTPEDGIPADLRESTPKTENDQEAA